MSAIESLVSINFPKWTWNRHKKWMEWQRLRHQQWMESERQRHEQHMESERLKKAVRCGTSGTRVELWMEGERPHVCIHTDGGDFAEVRLDLVKLRDRLTAEIEAGPDHCPLSPERHKER